MPKLLRKDGFKRAGLSLLAVLWANSATASSPPGAAPYPPELRRSLEAALAARGPGYEPRTHHLAEDGTPHFTNRLILEDSPYLLQHAHNPVDWYPWGEAAFSRAERDNKPVFLSIGYSTCHWCHVMERESFEDEAIARFLNRHFIAVKVDRERRPDVDHLYMTAVQLVSGSGGWPMSSFLTPQRQPFFGGTYYPPGHFLRLLERVEELWRTDRAALLESAARLAGAVAEVQTTRAAASEVDDEVFRQAVDSLLAEHDSTWGGFGPPPKFPQESLLFFLLDRARRSGRLDVRAALFTTLDAMARGGVHDQAAGGFHRYATDRRWLVPHFEKMLYNQAHLARVYSEAWQTTGAERYARISRWILDYVLREMTSPEGDFYSATDADSEGEEGRYFVWTPAEIRAALPEADAALAIELYAISEEGNFEGRNILHLPLSLAAFAEHKEIPLALLLERLEAIRERLREVRGRREPPLLDTKILTAWNGMMITALVRGAEVLGDQRYLEAASRAGELLWRTAWRGDEAGSLWRVRLGGQSSIPAALQDYAFLAEAFLALYDTTADTAWLERARLLTDAMLDRFWDQERGGFFTSAAGVDPLLITRPKNTGDGAVPAGNSVALRVLQRLWRRGGEERYRARAEATLAAVSGFLSERSAGFGYLLVGAAELLLGEVGPRQYGASGTVAAHARLDARGERIVVDVRVRQGWHLNSHQPGAPNLVATQLRLAEGGERAFAMGEVAYPPGEEVVLGFQDEPLEVYQGAVRFEASVATIEAAALVLPLALRIQACNDEVCLRPEELRLAVPVVRE